MVVRKRKGSSAAKKLKPLTSKRVTQWKTAKKKDTRILGDIQTELLRRRALNDNERDKTMLHPSEISHGDWCPRFSYYVISGEETTDEGKDVNFNLENIYEEGKDIHKKWQRRIDDLGKLAGEWKCLLCNYLWWATSPRECPECLNDNRRLIEYKEVPLNREDYMLLGHADGELDDDKPVALIEIKSIGLGTLRFEAPHLLEKYEIEIEGKKAYDLQSLWNDIKRPFPTHIKQGMLYCFCREDDNIVYIVFIYEFKPTQQVKEFILKYQPEIIEDILDKALDVKYALKKGEPPERPEWAIDEESPVCRTCPFKSICWELDATETKATNRASTKARKITTSRKNQGSRRSKSTTTKVRITSSKQTGRRITGSTSKTFRINRPAIDEPIRPSNGLGGLLKRAARDR